MAVLNNNTIYVVSGPQGHCLSPRWHYHSWLPFCHHVSILLIKKLQTWRRNGVGFGLNSKLAYSCSSQEITVWDLSHFKLVLQKVPWFRLRLLLLQPMFDSDSPAFPTSKSQRTQTLTVNLLLLGAMNEGSNLPHSLWFLLLSVFFIVSHLPYWLSVLKHIW